MNDKYDALKLDNQLCFPLYACSKEMEEKGYVSRARLKGDERNLQVTLTEEGEALRERALEVPMKIGACLRLEPTEALEMYRLLHKLLDNLSQEQE